MSSMVFSWRRIAAPSLTIRRATASSTRPSLVRWAFRRSTRGFPSQSNTSFNVSRWLRGKGTAEDRAQAHGTFKHSCVCVGGGATSQLLWLQLILDYFCSVFRGQWQRRHIMKEFMWKSYLRKPHPCFARRQCCAAAAAASVHLCWACVHLSHENHLHKHSDAICWLELNRT